MYAITMWYMANFWCFYVNVSKNAVPNSFHTIAKLLYNMYDEKPTSYIKILRLIIL